MRNRFFRGLGQGIMLAAAGGCLNACCQLSVSAAAQSVQREIAASLQEVRTQNEHLKKAIASGEYITVEHRDGSYIFIDRDRIYSDMASLSPQHKVRFVYFRSLVREETVKHVLAELHEKGIDVPFIVRVHNGHDPYVENVCPLSC